MANIFDYPQLVENISEYIFKDIDDYHDEEIYSFFLIPRKKCEEHIFSRINEVNNHGGNVLIIGEPGIGKTVFIKSFLKSELFNSLFLDDNYTLIDFYTIPYDEERPDDFLSFFICKINNIIREYFVKYHIDGGKKIDDSTDLNENIMNFHILSSMLLEYGVKNCPLNNHSDIIHYVFIDDVDYLDNTFFARILEYLRPLLLSPYFCVILACRVPAFNSIQNHYDNSITKVFKSATRYNLPPLSVQEILEPRLQTILQQGHSLKELLKKPGILEKISLLYENLKLFLEKLDADENTDIEDIDIFDYPFTPKQHDFIRMNSNDNIRYILEYAQEYLKYMGNNKPKLEKQPIGYKIGRENLIKHFSQDTIGENIRIRNLHERKTFRYHSKKDRKHIDPERVDNSIFVLILEMYHQFQSCDIDNSVFEALDQNYGVRREDIERGKKILINWQMIRERCIQTRPPLGHENQTMNYDLTPRGNYYLTYMLHWDQYIDKYGISKHHSYLRSLETRHTIISAVLEFTYNIYLLKKEDDNRNIEQLKVLKKEQLEKKHTANANVLEKEIQKLINSYDFKISKIVFCDFFNDLYKSLILFLDETDKFTKFIFRLRDITEILDTNLHIIETHNLEDKSQFLFNGREILRLSTIEYHFPKRIRNIYDINKFKAFFTTHVNTPEYDNLWQHE